MGLWALITADYHRFCSLCGIQTKRHAWRAFVSPRVAPVAWFRVSQALGRRGLSPLAMVISLLNLILFRVEIPWRAQIGPGFVLPHPGGIVIGSASIGRNVTIYQNVTLGARVFDGAYDLSTRPTLEDDVIVGAGAVVLGGIRVGQGATVAANSLVTRDVPKGQTALGVPATVQPQSTQPPDPT